jgi:hypothetical protein
MSGLDLWPGKVKRLAIGTLLALAGVAGLSHGQAAEAKKPTFVTQHWHGHLLGGPGTVKFAVRLKRVSRGKFVATNVHDVIVQEAYQCTSQGHTERQMMDEPFVDDAGRSAQASVNNRNGGFHLRGQNQSYSFDLNGVFAGGDGINPKWVTGFIFTLRRTFDNGETCEPTNGRRKPYNAHNSAAA